MRRLIQDIKEVTLDRTLKAQGIYYEHNMDDYMEGHAMVVGPRDTPYEDSLYYFRFAFPTNYPFAPPTVTLMNRTRDMVRLNPNLYVDGKVCLSILNTWQGEPWSACQTIRSVLLTLVTVLNEKPLMNEPGIPETHREHDDYNYVVEHASLHDCLLLPIERMLHGTPLAHEALFAEAMGAHFHSAQERVGARLARFLPVAAFGAPPRGGRRRKRCGGQGKSKRFVDEDEAREPESHSKKADPNIRHHGQNRLEQDDGPLRASGREKDLNPFGGVLYLYNKGTRIN